MAYETTTPQLHGSDATRRKRSTNPLVNTISMFDYKVDPERENEVLWGDKRGYAAYLERTQLKPMTTEDE
jgi:hypothetical protein